MFLIYAAYDYEGPALLGGRTTEEAAVSYAKELAASRDCRGDEIWVIELPDRDFGRDEGRMVFSLRVSSVNQYRYDFPEPELLTDGAEFDSVAVGGGGSRERVLH